jgi:hypothetical protein
VIATRNENREFQLGRSSGLKPPLFSHHVGRKIKTSENTMTATSSEDTLIADITSGKFKHIDGMFSPLTKRLIQEHGAADADITQFWIMTPQDWCCPVCKRSKGDIVRKDKNNRLICRLVEHHDHMNDILVKRFTAISATLKCGVVADDAAERFAKRSSAMVSAYKAKGII